MRRGDLVQVISSGADTALNYYSRPAILLYNDLLLVIDISSCSSRGVEYSRLELYHFVSGTRFETELENTTMWLEVVRVVG